MGRAGDHGWQAFWPRDRLRRPLDVAGLLIAAVALAGLIALTLLDPDLVVRSGHLVGAAPPGLWRTLLSLANVAASLAVIGVLVAIAVDELRRRRFAFTSTALAGAVAAVTTLALDSALAVTLAPAVRATVIGAATEPAGPPVAVSVALVLGADLQRRRWLGPAALALAVAVGCALALGSLTVPRAVYVTLIGATAGLGARVAVGVVPARPPDDVVRSVLERAGYGVTDLREQSRATGQVRYVGLRPGPAAEVIHVTVVDPDRRGVPFGRRAWRVLRLRTAAVGRPALSLRGQLERQSLSSALAESAGVPTLRALALLAAGPALVLVERPLAGTPLHAVTQPVSAAEAAWRALRRLHDAGLAHGALTADAVVVLPDGRAGFRHLQAAQPAATELQRDLDAVALLVATAECSSPQEAVAALHTGYGVTVGTHARLAALLQPLALPRRVRAAVRGTGLLSELRGAMTDPDGDGAPTEPVRLQRLRPRTVLGVVGGTAAAYILAGQVSGVDFGGVLRQAQPIWLAVALLGAALTFLGAALTRRAFTPVALPLGRTTLVQVASSFLTLVTPPAVGHIGLNIRYLQRAGVATAVAAATVTVSEAVTIALTVVLLLVCGWLSGVSGSRLALLPSGNVLAVLLVAATALVLAVAVPATRRLLRRRVEPLVRSTIPQLVATASDPRRLATALVGVMVLNGGNILALDASLRAFSATLAVPTLVVVYLAASTLGSAAPTPGGLGAVEAALVGGLTATGVPLAAALPAVLAFRTATFWLPAPAGWVAFIVLQRRGHI